jgi:hypothetical protein
MKKHHMYAAGFFLEAGCLVGASRRSAKHERFFEGLSGSLGLLMVSLTPLTPPARMHIDAHDKEVNP